jgi:hypothetical protein
MLALIRRLIPIVFITSMLAVTSAAQNTRFTVLISDTHLGVGRTSEGVWHPYEDGRWSRDFTLFLEDLNREGQGKTDLILNGDSFELWQSLLNDCDNSDKDLGCTEAQALSRLRTVLAAHRSELDAIRKFAISGNNTVVIVPGNHDAALLFPQVASEVLKAIGAPSNRVTISPAGYWVSSDGLVYAEHGHQIGNDTNEFSKWPRPFIEKQGTLYLERPWGEQFVQSFYNQLELKYPILDNIMDDRVALTFGISAEGYGGLIIDIGRLIRFSLTQMSSTQLVQLLGEDKAPQWDLAEIRRGGDRFFAESLANDDPLRGAVEESLKQGRLGIRISELSDVEIQSICNLRFALAREDSKAHRSPRLSTCPQKNLGWLATKAVIARDSIFRKYLEATFAKLRTAGATRRFALFVFSHTHVPESSYSPFEQSGDTSWRPIVVNTGAWQRTISDQELQRYMTRSGLKEKDVLKQTPDTLFPCYPVVVVAPYASTPQSQLKYWRQLGGSWSLADGCQ